MHTLHVQKECDNDVPQHISDSLRYKFSTVFSNGNPFPKLYTTFINIMKFHVFGDFPSIRTS